MADQYNFGTSSSGDPSGGFELQFDMPSSERVQQPKSVALVVAFLLLSCVALFLPAGKSFNLAGYLVGSAGIAIAAIVYRSITRTRRRDPMFGEVAWLDSAVSIMLGAGIVLAGLHAFFFALEHKVL